MNSTVEKNMKCPICDKRMRIVNLSERADKTQGFEFEGTGRSASSMIPISCDSCDESKVLNVIDGSVLSGLVFKDQKIQKASQIRQGE